MLRYRGKNSCDKNDTVFENASDLVKVKVKVTVVNILLYSFIITEQIEIMTIKFNSDFSNNISNCLFPFTKPESLY